MVGAAAGAGAQQAGGLAEGAGGTSGHDQKDGMPQTVSPHGCSDPPDAQLQSSPLYLHLQGIYLPCHQSTYRLMGPAHARNREPTAQTWETPNNKPAA